MILLMISFLKEQITHPPKKTENKYVKDLEKLEPLCTASGNVRCFSHCGKQW